MATNGEQTNETETALVVWVNSFPLTHHVDSLTEMSDGQALWEMLYQIDQEAFTGKLPDETQSSDSREQNLHFIHRQLTQYLEERGARYLELSNAEIRSIATDNTSTSIVKASCQNSASIILKTDSITKLLKLVLLAVITPPVSTIQTSLINAIMNLPAPTPKVMFGLIQDMDPSLPGSDEEEDQEYTDLDQGSELSINGSVHQIQTLDEQLSFEAEIARYKVHLAKKDREIADVRAEKEQVSDAYVRLEESYGAIKAQSAEHEDRLKKLSSAHSGMEQLSLKELEVKISQQEDVIARYESQINDHQSTESDLRRRLDKLSTTAESFQKIQDEFQIQRVQLEQQTKKANAGDKYKQKVQASQAVEKERESLRQQLEDVQPRLQAYDQIRRDNAKLEKENHEIGLTLSRSERDNNELRETKQAVQNENSRLQRDSRALREALAQGQDRIADLEEKSGSSTTHSSPTVVDGGLENELAETSKHDEQLQVTSILLWWTRGLTFDRKLRIAELEKQNQQLMSDMDEKEAKSVVLQRQLDKLQDSSADHIAMEFKLRQDINNLEESIIEVRAGHPIEGTQTFKNMREKVKEQQKICLDLEERLSTAQQEVEAAASERELLGKSELDMIKRVKKENPTELTQLRSEHNALRKRYNRLQQEFERQFQERNQAWRESHEAMVQKGQADAENAAATHSHQDLADVIAKSLKPTADSIKDTNDFSQQNIEILTSKIEEFYVSPIEAGRARLAKAQQTVEQQDVLIRDLKGRLEHERGGTPSTALPQSDIPSAPIPQAVSSREDKAYTQNLERELKLMASAYHDLASRLQSDHVSLQRRAEAPKSWLGRQRKAMEGVKGLTR